MDEQLTELVFICFRFNQGLKCTSVDGVGGMPVVSDFTALLQSSISSTPGKAAFYTFSFASAPPAYLSAIYSPAQLATFLPMNDAQKAASRLALDAWASVSGITFFEVTNSVGDINFGIYDLAALGSPGAAGFAYYGSPTVRDGFQSDVFLLQPWASNAYVLLHEIGHALGLKHPFDGSTTLDPALDDVTRTVLSYTFRGGPGDRLGSLDIAAIQYLYGTNSNDGSQVASWNWNTAIETLTQNGGAADDVIAGVASRDVIFGGAGNDKIDSGSGGDYIDGGDGSDNINAVIASGYGAVAILGGGGNDAIQLRVDAALPAFSIDGGAGTDSLNIFSFNSTRPLNLSLSGDGVSSGLVINVENIQISGTSRGDNITGSMGVDTISTFGGNAIIRAAGGNDSVFTQVSSLNEAIFIDGGDGNDYVGIELKDTIRSSFSNIILIGGAGSDIIYFNYYGTQSLTFSIGASIASGSQITGFEFFGLQGSSANDLLTGSDFADTIFGRDGNDSIIGGLGRDALTGGNGADTFVFLSAADSLAQTPDTIFDFTTGVDVIDLTAFPVWNLAVAGSQLTGVGLAGNFAVSFNGSSFTTADIRSQSVGLYAAGTNAVDTLIGQAGRDYLNGAGGNDSLRGAGGNDFLSGGAGNDALDGGTDIDTAIYAATRAQSTVTRNAGGTVTVTSTADGTDTVSNVELFQFADGLFSFRYADPGGTRVNNFAINAGGWSSQDRFSRHVADVNGDGFADIVGFGQAGTFVSYGQRDGSFSAVTFASANFGANQGWTSDNAFRRELIDVNRDGRADIVGFGVAGVFVSLAQANGTFAAPVLGNTNFNQANGWSNQDAFARTLGDVNGDGFADVVGFGVAGTFVALGRGDGTFGAATFAGASFGANQGWTSDNRFHRTVADVNGDGRADVIGFGVAGTFVGLGQANGTFAAPTLAQATFGTNQGWSSQDAFARLAGDVNGDGRADVVGFGVAGTFVSYGQSDGTFSAVAFDVANFGANQGWTSNNLLPRDLADLNNDGRADIIGFGFNGVFASTAFAG